MQKATGRLGVDPYTKQRLLGPVWRCGVREVFVIDNITFGGGGGGGGWRCVFIVVAVAVVVIITTDPPIGNKTESINALTLQW